MSNFSWVDAQARPLQTRYTPMAPLPPPNDVLGVAEWERFAQQFPYPTPEAAWPLLAQLHGLRLELRDAPRNCPRVLISHRHIDEHLARRIAWVANQEQVEYWLDVLDLPAPPLKPLNHGLVVPANFNQAILLAALIEMALINCTHVLAVMTPDTAGSQWVPYEYGRIKDDPPAHLAASCWRHPHLPVSDLPEYIRLAPVLDSELMIRQWLRDEGLQFPQCTQSGSGKWPTGDVPEALPV